MTLITSPVPAINSPNANEQVDTTNLLQEIKNLLNGGLALDNFGTLLQQITNPPIVTALPGSPVTGQRVRFRAAPGVLWPLRYNDDLVGSAKWEADGQGPALVSTAVGSGALPASGGALTVPLAGTYDVTAYAELNPANPDGDVSLAVGGVEVGHARTNTSGARLDYGPTRGALATGSVAVFVNPAAGGSMYVSGFAIRPVVVG